MGGSNDACRPQSRQKRQECHGQRHPAEPPVRHPQLRKSCFDPELHLPNDRCRDDKRKR